MKADRAMADLPGLEPQVNQSLAELAILSAPAHALVEAIDLKDVVLPAGSVVPVPTGPGSRDGIQKAGLTPTDSESQRTPESSESATPKPP